MQRIPLLAIFWLPILLALSACSTTLPHARGDIKPVIVLEKSERPATAAASSEILEPPLHGSSAITPIEVETRALEPIAVVGVERLPLMRGDEKPGPHIALLLPLKSENFIATAEAVQLGFMAAASAESHGVSRVLPVRVYGSFDESHDIVALYRRAIADGAQAVVGPLTRAGAGMLAAEQNIPVPTLVLNIAEGQFANRLYFFGMMVEDEARQAAQLARQQGLRRAIVITTQAQLARRLQFAFEEAWQGLGGVILREIEFDNDTAVLADITDLPDTVIFLAADAEKAHLIRPYLPNTLPIYATSRIFLGNHETLINYDLNGIRFVDMPWLLQADHPAVMIYPRADPPLPIDHERFYALGIDAFRLVQLLLVNRAGASLSLDGVSGDIRLNRHVFQRTAMPAVFAQGQALSSNSQAAPALPVFPDQLINQP